MRTSLLALTLALAAASSPAIAGDLWDKTDYALLGTAAVTTYIDWRQTQYIARHPETFHETNTIMGPHPSVTQVNAYFAYKSILEGAITYWIPGEYRKYFLGYVAAVEIQATAHNRSIGVKFQF